MEKKVKNLYLRKGEHKFILQSIFICRAKSQKWTNEEINEVIEKTRSLAKVIIASLSGLRVQQLS